MPHLFVDISAHGYGHLAQVAPVLRRLAELLPGLRLTLRSGLPEAKLRQRIALPFDHIAAASDFGYVMIDALRIDLAATATAYRAAHAGFASRIDDEARLFEHLRPDCVLTDVSYLPLAGAARAGAARAGIPAVSMCSLNWADLFLHHFGHEAWAAPIHADMIKAYRCALFLRVSPGMDSAALENIATIGPIAGLGRDRRRELRAKVGSGDTAPGLRIVIVALGGIPTRLPVESWPALPNTHWLVPVAWQVQRPDMSDIEAIDWAFTDLLRSVDAVVTKPGYGIVAEAACNGTAVLYQRREDWPEQDCLIEWLQVHARCVEVSGAALQAGDLGGALDTVLATPAPTPPAPTGIEQAAQQIAAMLA